MLDAMLYEYGFTLVRLHWVVILSGFRMAAFQDIGYKREVFCVHSTAASLKGRFQTGKAIIGYHSS